MKRAKLDCDQALQIDGDNVDARYRLALAQRGLEVRASVFVSKFHLPNGSSGLVNVSVRVVTQTGLADGRCRTRVVISSHHSVKKEAL